MRNLRLLALIGLLLFPLNAWSGYFSDEDPGLGPLTGRNQMMLLNLFYIPPLSDGETMGAKKFEGRVDFDLTNNSHYAQNGGNLVAFDLEMYRTSFHLSYGLLDSLDVHLEIPTVSTSDGFLDGFLNGYHHAFGFPDGGRDQVPEDQFAYRVVNGNTTIVNYAPLGFTLGDVNLDLKWRVLKEASWWPSIALKTGIKFPTGDFSNGSGSGKTDYAFGFALSKSVNRFHFFGGFDGILIDTKQPLTQFLDQDHLLHYFFGAEWVLIKEYLSFVLQFENQTTPYVPTGLEAFDKDVFDIIPGFRGSLFDRRVVWQAALREDLVPYSSVDVTASFSLAIRL